MIGKAEIDRRLSRHPAALEKQDALAMLRATAKFFAGGIDAECPDCSEKSSALAALETCLFYAIAAVVRPPAAPNAPTDAARRDAPAHRQAAAGVASPRPLAEMLVQILGSRQQASFGLIALVRVLHEVFPETAATGLSSQRLLSYLYGHADGQIAEAGLHVAVRDIHCVDIWKRMPREAAARG